MLAAKVEKEVACPKPSQYRSMYNPTANPELVKRAVILLLNAENPLIIAGGGVVSAKAEKELNELADYLKIPITTTIMGSSGILKETASYIGGPGLLTSNTQKAIMETDMVLALGARFSLSLMFGKAPIWAPRNQEASASVDKAGQLAHKTFSYGTQSL